MQYAILGDQSNVVTLTTVESITMDGYHLTQASTDNSVPHSYTHTHRCMAHIDTHRIVQNMLYASKTVLFPTNG